MKSGKSMKAPDRPTKPSKLSILPHVDINVKLYFQQNWKRDVRVFQTPNRAEYRKFVKNVKQVLKLRDNTHIVLKWQDVSGDLITISSDLEMQLATKSIRHNDTLNVCVQLLDEVTIPTLCDKCDQTIICNIRYKCERCVNFVCCVRCYQAAQIKTNIHEHELYKEKFPCYCPMHRVQETDVQPFPTDRAASVIPFLMRNYRNGVTSSDHRDRSSSLPDYNRSGSMSSMGSMSAEDLMRNLYPSAPSSPCPDYVPSEHTYPNYRTAERSEVVRGPNGDVYRQQQTSVIQNPESGVVAIRSRRTRESRSSKNQLG